jgi:ABC-type sugar transport system ATPase subunit
VRVRAAGGEGATIGQKLILSLRPEDISLHLGPPQNAADGNLLAGEVIDTVYLGSFLACRVSVGRYELGIQLDHYEQLLPGQHVFLTFAADHALCLTK